MDKTIGFTIFTTISAVVALFFIGFSWYRYKYQRKSGKILSTVQLLTVGIFTATVLFFVPVYYGYYFESGNWTHLYGYVKPFFLSVHNTFRLFILDGDFNIILDALSDESGYARFWCAGYALALYIIAPVLTFSNVLSLFEHLWDGFRYHITRKKNLYVFSELNARSLVLAKDISERAKKEDMEIKNPLIVFCGVHERDEEENAEMLMQARELHAVCLKTDITSLGIQSKKRDVELFIMGDNEAENVSKAAKITNDLNKENKKRNIKLFVFNQSEGAGHVIDSLKYEKLLQKNDKKKENEPENTGYTFKLRRVDEKQQLVWNTLPEMNIFGYYNDRKKDLYVLIAGLGIYGMEFFKTILWFAQLDGHRLHVTVADKRERAEIVSVIKRQCPDVLKKPIGDDLGEAYYDIEIIDGVDVSGAALADILLYEEDGYGDVISCLCEKDEKTLSAWKKRLFKTDIAIVALGEDNRNIETAVHFRTVFERVKESKLSDNKEAADVTIYSVVYDELISSNLYNGDLSKKNSEFLVNHKDTPYHIHFIGSLAERFTYKNIHDAAIEESAYKHHTGWVEVGQRIYDKWESENKTELLKKCFKTGRPECEPEQEKEKFERFEYFRMSSIARELYVRELDKEKNAALKRSMTCEIDAQKPPADCLCESCARRKRSEHMRWNAYMRSCGFSYYKGKKNERAQLHNNLCSWQELNEYEQCKD